MKSRIFLSIFVMALFVLCMATVSNGQKMSYGRVVNPTINAAAAVMQFSTNNLSGREGTSVTVTVTRTGSIGGTSTVDYATVEESAVSGTCGNLGVHYEDASGTLIFGPWVTTRTFIVKLCPDYSSENPSQTIGMQLSHPTGGTVGSWAYCDMMILDTATAFSSATKVSITPGDIGSPYGTSLKVSGYPGPIGGVRVSLYGVTHANPDNLQALLVSPGGKAFLLMAGTGGSNVLDNGTITLEDIATVYLPDALPIADGINYRPAACGPTGTFPAPAPGTYAKPGCGVTGPTMGGAFGGVTGDGNWKLYLRDINGITKQCLPGTVGQFCTTATVSGWGLQILLPTAAEAQITGQVRTDSGLGIRNAVVTVSGPDLSQPVSVLTGSFGYYTVDGLRTGSTYIVSASSKRFVFMQPIRVLPLIEDASDIDFVALP